MSLDTRYKILEKIGSGSFATVYRARDTELGREVAIKQLHDEFVNDPQRMERFWQEAQLLASLQHPNIVTYARAHAIPRAECMAAAAHARDIRVRARASRPTGASIVPCAGGSPCTSAR